MGSVMSWAMVPRAVMSWVMVPWARVRPVMPGTVMPVPMMPVSGLRHRDVMRNGFAYDSAGTVEKVDYPQYQEDHCNHRDKIHIGLFCHL